MNSRPNTSQSRMLIAVGILVLTVLACGATSAGPAPTATPVLFVTAPKGSVTPRAVPTLVPTYTRVPTWTPTVTYTPTNTRTTTPTRTVTPTFVPTSTPLVYRPPEPVKEPDCTPPEQRADLRGKIIFVTDRESTAAWVHDSYFMMDEDGKNQKPLSASARCSQLVFAYFEQRLAITSDGKWQLTVEDSGQGTSIFLRDAAGVLARRVTTLDKINYSPAWAPDQSRLAFVSEIDMNDEIYTVTVDGTKTRRLTFNTWEWDKHPSWSPDGKFIVFWSNRETMRKQIWVMRSDDGGGARNISNSSSNDWDPIWVLQ